jgi:hypothetical protein
MDTTEIQAGQDVQVSGRRAFVERATKFHLTVRYYYRTSWGLVLTGCRSMISRSEATACAATFAALQAV